ncbi:DUF7504 family protein [Haloplanus halophilus]|uniref:DUF7504 family protein n=1 Tax=Haloplanus halophilus TaxID=2949993 RepID=UPI00203D7D31|nr:hypothetical protein [Haloplanus sp. GDY1]
MSTLHLTDAVTTVGARQCANATPSPDKPTVIVVALAGSPGQWLDRWERAADTDTDRATFVVDDATSWLAGDPRDRLAAESSPDTEVCVRTVASPGNLTDIGVTLTEVLDEESTERALLCFQSLTVLLQYAPLDEVYQFLHTLVAHVDRAGATAHFHLHEAAHDEETVDTLRPLFDRVRGDAE